MSPIHHEMLLEKHITVKSLSALLLNNITNNINFKLNIFIQRMIFLGWKF